MPSLSDPDIDALWKRLGLQELREALIRTEGLARNFEAALKALPSCDDCARVALLDQIRKTGGALSSETVSLSVLAVNLKEAVAVAEKAQAGLAANAPTPCHCPEDQCTCHD